MDQPVNAEGQPELSVVNTRQEHQVEAAANETEGRGEERHSPGWPPLSINQLHAMGPAELEKLAQQFSVTLPPARTRHYRIVDLLRAALNAGAVISATGFIDQAGDGFVLRWP